jgi:hypothetical protein
MSAWLAYSCPLENFGVFFAVYHAEASKAIDWGQSRNRDVFTRSVGGRPQSGDFASPPRVARTRSTGPSLGAQAEGTAAEINRTADEPLPAASLSPSSRGHLKTFYTVSIVLWCRWVRDSTAGGPSTAYKLYSQTQVLSEVLELGDEPVCRFRLAGDQAATSTPKCRFCLMLEGCECTLVVGVVRGWLWLLAALFKKSLF